MTKPRVRLDAPAATSTIRITSYEDLELSADFCKLMYAWVILGKEDKATDQTLYTLTLDCSPMGNKAIVALIGQLKALLISEGFEVLEYNTIVESLAGGMSISG